MSRVTITITADLNVALSAQVVADNIRNNFSLDPNVTDVAVKVEIDPSLPTVATSPKQATVPLIPRIYDTPNIARVLDHAVKNNQRFGSTSKSYRIGYRTKAGVFSTRVIVPLDIDSGRYRYDPSGNVSTFDKDKDAPRTFKVGGIEWIEEVA